MVSFPPCTLPTTSLPRLFSHYMHSEVSITMYFHYEASYLRWTMTVFSGHAHSGISWLCFAAKYTLRCLCFPICAFWHIPWLCFLAMHNQMSHVVHSDTFHDYVFWPCTIRCPTLCTSNTFHDYVFWPRAFRGFPSCALWHIPWLCFLAMCTWRFSNLCTLTHSITMSSGNVHSEVFHLVHSDTFHDYAFWPCAL